MIGRAKQTVTCCRTDCGGWIRRLAASLAVATTVCTLPLLFSGGSVTSYGVGMAVPDWPTTFGENMVAYNMLEAPFGVQVEHGHRLIGMVVGMLGMATLAATLAARVDCAARALVGAGFIAICLQGVLGGLRVELNKAGLGPQLAIAHGVFGQITFCLLVAGTATLVAPRRAAAASIGEFGSLRLLTKALPALWLSQLITGALVRHLGHGFVLHVALAGGLFVAGLAVIVPVLVHPTLLRSDMAKLAGTLGALLLVQILLGVGAAMATELVPPNWRTWSPSHGAAMLRTAHQFNSALLGATMLAIAWRAHRNLQVGSPAETETVFTLEATS